MQHGAKHLTGCCLGRNGGQLLVVRIEPKHYAAHAVHSGCARPPPPTLVRYPAPAQPSTSPYVLHVQHHRMFASDLSHTVVAIPTAQQYDVRIRVIYLDLFV